MPEQFFLPGLQPAPRPTDRLFYAVFPAPDAAARIAAFAAQLCASQGLRGRPLAASRLHVTLHHLGDYLGLPQDLVDHARAAGDAVAMRPFDAEFDAVGSFAGRRGRHPIVLLGGDGVAGLDMLQRRLCAALAPAGPARDAAAAAPYTPHVTLLYGDRTIAERPIDAVRWRVGEFVLVRSLLGRSRYERLATWPLAA
ncbi:2'-5' RNA ligase family protein [Pigmentiphaga soli]|uniref:RNA 2',3'-cyclic phosphodiesterase n=1 Tax=Pigmentiphaga soli TaxID=1007095 RepID=A0ABP8GKF1_9BURK